ncbi:DUF427 domain-containing protein [Nocardia sp. NPDC005978]|uniref:DUF427 domain-containing protein n=1 Tax=Nocardia sp. NPDC005978 TaxID=3156725 RepID=UPI00339DCCEB
MDSGYVDWPDYRVDVSRVRNVVRATLDGMVLAESATALLVAEQDHGIVFYFPAADVRFDLLEAAVGTSRCPFKGEARYWREIDGSEPIAWEYPDPYPEVAILHGHLAFYQNRVSVQVGVATPAVQRPS